MLMKLLKQRLYQNDALVKVPGMTVRARYLTAALHQCFAILLALDP